MEPLGQCDEAASSGAADRVFSGSSSLVPLAGTFSDT
jgi:hypothetical protein